MRAVWPDSFVEESNLTRNISVLRKVLSPNGGGPHYIETVPKFGYRFVGEVRALAGEGAARAAVDEVPRHNLPDQLTSFVGRDREISEIERLLASTRLLTLTGAGGCGKTRLALQVAAASLPRFKDGAWVVELAPLSEANLVTQTVATVLGVREGSTRSLRDSVLEHLRHRHILLVLDNCEHVIGACAELAEALVRGAPHLRILATSREGLGISGETVWRVPSLSLPDTSRSLSPEALLEFEATRLFVERATAVDPSLDGRPAPRRHDRGHLSPAGRHTPGDRIGRGPGERAVGGADQHPAERSVPAPHRRQQDVGGPATYARRHGRLEL